MKLKKLLKLSRINSDSLKGNPEITGIEFDSRKIKKGNLFIALEGFNTDGHNYVKTAFDKGASICLINKDKENVVKKNLSDELKQKLINVDNTRKAMPFISRAFLEFPDKKMTIVGITGTKGKTTTTYIIKAALESAGKKVGLIGTIQHLIGDENIKSKNTTPESLDLYKLMDRMCKEGVEYLVMEVSSHALSLNRVGEMELDVAIFTNFSQDHLDFHKTMKEYFEAKLKIFDLLKKSTKKNKIAVLNYDIPEYKKLLEYTKGLNLKSISYGFDAKADIFLKEVKSINLEKTVFITSDNLKGNSLEVKMNLIGDFNIYNSLSAITVLKYLMINNDNIKDGLNKVNVPGRLERMSISKDSVAIVDYAHTDAALENVLSTIKKLKPKKIITVFGCGGDRDKTKRPKMGEVVAKFSDVVIVTSDNPRTEDPSKIIDDIIPGIEKHKPDDYYRIEDREEAINFGLSKVEEFSVLIVAGKGHEDYQILKDKTIHFSDREIINNYINNNIHTNEDKNAL